VSLIIVNEINEEQLHHGLEGNRNARMRNSAPSEKANSYPSVMLGFIFNVGCAIPAENPPAIVLSLAASHGKPLSLAYSQIS